jgi:hypothetical protein
VTAGPGMVHASLKRSDPIFDINPRAGSTPVDTPVPAGRARMADKGAA